ncbi:MAG: succinate dehydrogenase cytochrome b subunit [Chloroflexota bacterium]|nr:MAG: succinate dehydrogenase cytochrome b subunit [Chloroflexota bacterium]
MATSTLDNPHSDTTRRHTFLTSSIGAKLVVAITGLLLLLYLFIHLAGNLLILLGPTTFNAYSDLLIKNPLIVPVEIGLAIIFLLHISRALANWRTNAQARPTSYYQASRRMFGYGWAGGSSRKSASSTWMVGSGLFTLFFVIVHVRQFRFGAEYAIVVAGRQMNDLYRIEMEVFSNPLVVLAYVFAIIVVATHLWHGISSALQSLGVDHPRLTVIILRGGRIISYVIAIGFIFVPIWALVTGGRS